jgi:pyruvate/2-oxoglutarate dehydrogenase complex dihydrolipoamide dehydrogenase (E3) component
MAELLTPDLCVVGAGSAGLSVAAGASQLGAPTVLVEAGRMGGDCLNYGCVPSKALLAAARAVRAIGEAAAFGVAAGPARVDFAAVRAHLRDVIDGIAPNDSEARFTGLGVRVVRARARFTGPAELAAGDLRIRARRFVLATGSEPLLPPVPGLAETPHLTNETVFDLAALPEHLLVLGGGPIGCELAQAFRGLGAAVTLVERARLLPKDDPELVEVVRRRLAADGIQLQEGAEVVRAAPAGAGVALTLRQDGAERVVAGSALLVAAGRRPRLDGLDLAAAGIAHDARGITVDAGLRTSNRRVYAIGDAVGGLQFTHVAGYHAGLVIRSALFRLPARVSTAAIPWVTYTEPELAQVGLTEDAARERHGAIRILRWPFAENDRARTERVAGGFVKVVTSPRGRILGASIVGPQAGELIQPWVLAIARGLGIGAMAQLVLPYPTLGEAGKRAAGSYFLPKLFGPRSKRLVRFLRRFG